MKDGWEGQTVVSSCGNFGRGFGHTRCEVVRFWPRKGKALPDGVEQHRYTVRTPEGPVDITPGQWIAMLPTGERWVCEDLEEHVEATPKKRKRPARKSPKQPKATKPKLKKSRKARKLARCQAVG